MYNKFPAVSVRAEDGFRAASWAEIAAELGRRAQKLLIVDCYPGIDYEELREELIRRLSPERVIFSDALTLPRERIEMMIAPNLTEDRVFGTMSYARMEDYYDPEKLARAREDAERPRQGLTIVYGVGASLVSARGILVYADLCRWEIQLRYRRGQSNWLAENGNEDPLRKFKRGYFWEWRIADRHKLTVLERMDYYLDTNMARAPRMISGRSFASAMKQTARRPFRTVPYFDPGVWGGQWMKRVCALDEDQPNFAWSFDGVPEENALLLDFDGTTVQTPCLNLVLTQPRALLGDKVYARFGAEFPIRFDLLDTMGGQNLSLQVHPRTSYIQSQFGMHYTQDESYYLLDAGEDAAVFLGLKDGVSAEEMIHDLTRAQEEGVAFDAQRFVNRFPARKHDHFLIPAGTVHCSGANSMVLEISSTPYIFTFKLWDWGRLGLDGRPRPTHIAHGQKNIAWERKTEWVRNNLVNRVETVARGEGWIEERTGLHELEFIETRRHWFDRRVSHHTGESVNVLNLVEGRQAVVESPTGAFEPLIVHYAETFIIPASVGAYTITPDGESAGQTIATIKAYVRT